jgi:hypothetical protein
MTIGDRNFARGRGRGGAGGGGGTSARRHALASAAGFSAGG